MSNQAHQQNQFTDLLIKAEEVKQLDSILGELPTKWGLTLINFFQAVSQKRFQEAQALQAGTVSTDSGEIKG